MKKKTYLYLILLFFSISNIGCLSQIYKNFNVNREYINEEISNDNSSEEEIDNKEKEEKIEKIEKDKKKENYPKIAPDPQATFDEALQFCEASQDFWQKGNIDQAILSLDKAYSLILSIDLTKFPEFSREREELRFLLSKRLVEIYTSKITAINGNGKTIPIVLNDYVKAEIDNYTRGREKTTFIEAYKLSGRYRPYIVKALKEAGLPEELSWLPFIESSFKLKALSKARALGLWQFIASTGYKYGLKRDRYIDERLDPIKSTNAAINYLKDLHNIFGDWTTSLAAYNSGETRILRIIKTQNVNYLDNFWDFYEKLPQETAKYVPRFLAVIHVVNNLEKYGLENLETYSPLSYETATINKQMHLKDIAKSIDVSYETIKDLNPELRYQITPAGGYVLKLPSSKSAILMANIDEIPTSYLKRTTYIYHKIQNGETLSDIAKKYQVSMNNIAEANNIKSYSKIIAGRSIKIPKTKLIAYTSSFETGKKQDASSSNNNFYYKVESGDALWTIARRYDTNVKKLKKLNNLDSEQISVGQILKIK